MDRDKAVTAENAAAMPGPLTVWNRAIFKITIRLAADVVLGIQYRYVKSWALGPDTPAKFSLGA